MSGCKHRRWELNLASGERRCVSCGKVLGVDDVRDATTPPPPPPRGSLRTLFEVRGRAWFFVWLGAAAGAVSYWVWRVLP